MRRQARFEPLDGTQGPPLDPAGETALDAPTFLG